MMRSAGLMMDELGQQCKQQIISDSDFIENPPCQPEQEFSPINKSMQLIAIGRFQWGQIACLRGTRPPAIVQQLR